MIEGAVVDVSVAVKWVVSEPGSEEALMLSQSRLYAPDLLVPEISNVLWKKVRRRELTEDDAAYLQTVAADVPVTLYPVEQLAERALRLALKLRHPVYDCLYLALAEELGIPVITADGKFARAARQDGETRERVMLLEEVTAE